MNDRLYRSRDDRIIGGVCAGLADRLDLDPALVRIGWVVLTVLTGGLLLLLYIVMLVVVPEEGDVPMSAPRQPEPGAVPGWVPPAPGTAWSATSGPRPGDAGTGWTPPAGTEPTPGPAPDASGPAAAGGWTAPAGMSRAEMRAARRAARRERRRSGDPVAALVFGAILVLLGLYFLAQQYLPELDLGRFWPVVVIAVGVILIVRAFYRPSSDA